MRFDRKKALRAAVLSLFFLVFFGGIFFVLFLFSSLGMFPLYVTKVIPIVGAAVVLALILINSDYLSTRGRRRVGAACLAVCVGCSAYAGYGFYKDSIPTVDDRGLLLRDYQPFEVGTKTVSLEEPATLRFDNAWTLSLDGATALYPVYAGFVQAVYPKREDFYSPFHSSVECNGTITAYERLIQGEVDMIFAAAPSKAQLKAAEEAGVELHMTPIGREAFVFFVNSKNPVTSLTVEQIQGIYSGTVTNWREVGGRNQRIRPFQRAEDSGSQSALQRLMDGLPLIEPEEEDRIGGMGGIIREVASYRNYKNAIGFSFRYYATEMVQNGDIRLLALNGVAPTKETIRDGSYPIASEFYAVTAAPAGQPALERNEDAAAFLAWILSSQGQEIVEKTGYVALQ